jgi:Flp pilus assembly protein CpaB
MAARRLLILMLVLLAVSTLAAALVPPQAQRDGTTSATDTNRKDSKRPRERRPPPGRLVSRTIEVSPHGTDRIELRRGDQLALAVRSRVADQVEIPAFGGLDDVAPDAPARFNLLLDRSGVFSVRLLEARRTIARIKVGPTRRPRQP